MFCPKCGTQSSETYRFCGKCGADLTSAAAKDQEHQHAASIVSVQTHDSKVKEQTSTKQSPAQTIFSTMPEASTESPMTSVTGHDKESGKKKGIKKAYIAIPVAAVLLLTVFGVCFFSFLFAEQPCYVIKERTSAGYTYDYDRDENGMTSRITTMHDGKASVTEYKELIEGLAIPDDTTGRYEKDASGNVVSIEQFDSNGKTSFTRTYEYYKPGIIKSSVDKMADGSSTSCSYNEDGWITILKKGDVSGNVTEYSYSYSSSNNGKTVTVSCSRKDSTGIRDESTIICELDDNGNVVTNYNKATPSERTLTKWEKIEDPAEMIRAISRLKTF